MNTENRAALELAQERGYLVARTSERELTSAWSEWCRLNHRPDVAVRSKRTRASVQLDLDWCLPRLSDEEQKIALSVIKPLIEHHGAYAGAGIGPGDLSVSNVPIAQAVELAQSLVDLLKLDARRYSSQQQVEIHRAAWLGEAPE